MTATHRPYRSVLYIPGSNARAIEKARGLKADALILDLEDAVSPDEKPAARARVSAVLSEGGFGGRTLIVRINGLDTEWGRADAEAMAQAGAEAVLLPKVSCPAELDALAALVPQAALWAMMETPAGVLNAAAIAAHPRLAGFVLGTNDLAKDLGCLHRPDRLPLITSLELCLLAARAHGRICVDGVYNAFRDTEGLRAEAEQGRALGMDGKTLIHPAQIDVVNEVFAPTAEEIELARRQIAAFEAAQAEGKGVAVVDGRIVENLHVETARATLSKADAIAALETEFAR
ncbi:(3S)-malyl-CoA thioesterase [Meinhardsimonia xiamenensis]|jgi:(3S)-malyl-CoA thioesterase|uniref:(3S)-malyl-CoA thioesterase n=1 Tax=Meinhardsimonia xiamenensis TaxID=990712 RepID=A0A1G9EIU3_9RHOB|nr:CoA ester lyase [Meinhardsimonia xiamenensis]PRX33747.1 (3S)-malyl-CoA thioesterase [Meinhardsimonia xiamenensis]SDK76087.1 (3S)-malyl-CoA thioesterase [Meinhardsimonia xiamenensis]